MVPLLRCFTSPLALLLVLAMMLVAHSARAVDLYSFFDKECRRSTGLLIHADDTRVVLVGLDGRMIRVRRSAIHSLVLHQVLENPLPQLQVRGLLRQHLRQIWTEHTERPTFSGWLAGFQDDLLIFFDTEGKTHVLEANEIVRLRPVPGSQTLHPAVYHAVRLAFPAAMVPCSTEEPPVPPATSQGAPLPASSRPTSRPTSPPVEPEEEPTQWIETKAPVGPSATPAPQSAGSPPTVTPPAPSPAPVTAPSPAPATTAPSPASAPAHPASAAPEAPVLPSHSIADRIKIDDLLTAFAERYRDFANLEERTHVYARPFHLEPTLRLGLAYFQEAGLARYFPFYFLWSGGKPYGFQSRVVIGTTIHDALPLARPTLSAGSEIKSHFFHAVFIGQLPALPAESDAFLTDSDEVDPYSVTLSYNYLILMGVDYWRLSASIGPAYFAFRLKEEEGLEATIPATSASLVFRLQYRGESFQVQALYFRTRLTDEVNDFGLNIPFELGCDTVRFGGAATLPYKISASVDQIVSVGSGEAQATAFSPIAISFTRAETALMLGAQFGRYIAVKAFGRLLWRRYERAPLSAHTSFDPYFGGALEFVFY